MRSRAGAVAFILISLEVASGVIASEIRELDLSTTERLGNELVEESKEPDHIFTREQVRARETAIAVLKSKLYDAQYHYVVLNDPDRRGFLVYALATTQTKGEILTGGHYRVTVSEDGSKAERVDLLSPLITTIEDPDHKMAAIVGRQTNSSIPVETWIYSSYLYGRLIYISTSDRGIWRIWNGSMHRFSEAEMAAMEKTEKKRKSTAPWPQ